MGSLLRLFALAAPVAFSVQTACAPPVAPSRPTTAVVASPAVAAAHEETPALVVAADTGKPRTAAAIVVELKALEQLAVASHPVTSEQAGIYRRLAESYVELEGLAFGERLFLEAGSDPSRLALAEQAYQKATEIPPPGNPIWGYAHYKLAYVAWNQGDLPRALAGFQRVIEFATRFASLPNAAQLGVTARRDLVAVYASIGEPSKAYDFFQPLSGDAAGESSRTLAMSIQLGKSYVDTGHYRECALLDLDLLQRTPAESSCPPLVQLDRVLPRLSPADAAALRAPLDKHRKLIAQARTLCPSAVAAAPDGPIRKCAAGDPCGGL
jgi:tetratricopeptide (TPR) repeat protein